MSRLNPRVVLHVLVIALCSAASGKEHHAFVQAAQAKHGDWGERAARFLLEHMPEADREKLALSYLMENLDYAARAKEAFPWAKKVPDEIFFNDVLPYAVFDEPRDPWRAELYEIASELVREAQSASEAAQILNRDFFNVIQTHYHRGRARANQSAKESMALGKASCTGLSILLVNACRAVGIPARAVGTPMWWNNSGNHTWVEVWDGEWLFMGADEYDPKGLSRGWFVENAARASQDDPTKAIYATSWERDQVHFPMVWSPKRQTVGAVNVTARYTAKAEKTAQGMGIRLLDGPERVAAEGWLTKVSGFPIQSFHTKAGRADYNDTPRVDGIPGERYRWKFRIGDKFLESELFEIEASGPDIHDVALQALKPAPDFSDPERALTRMEAERAIDYVYDEILDARRDAMERELSEKKVHWNGLSMRWKEKSFGEAPWGKRSLWISMHGGGGAPKQVNDRQWENQIRLYEPEEGIYLAPRAPTDTWNLWHQEHIDPMFSRLIEAMVALRGVDPDRVYLMGYSAGGDGVWQLAPRMADRFAAAAMMAGHPNESQLLGLRNLPFAIFMGGNDNAYNRARVAGEKAEALAKLQEADPEGYVHLSRVYEGMGHWMNRKDAEALPWMQQFTRKPWPEKIVWHQDDVTHDRFYWLKLPEGSAEKGQSIRARIEGRTFHLSGDIPNGTQIVLSDAMLDLDKTIEIRIDGREALRVTPKRTVGAIRESLEARLDRASAYVGKVAVPQ